MEAGRQLGARQAPGSPRLTPSPSSALGGPLTPKPRGWRTQQGPVCARGVTAPGDTAASPVGPEVLTLHALPALWS